MPQRLDRYYAADTQAIERLMASLIRDEGVTPAAIERAVTSAENMRPGEHVALGGDEALPMRYAFVQAQTARITRPGRWVPDGERHG